MTIHHTTVIEDISTDALAQSWEYTDADTQYLTHNIHRYSGKFIPQIAARAISLLTHPGELVVDPYCGSGTTLLESALLGRRAIGIDLNPLAVLIARVKTTPIPEGDLNLLIETLGNELATSGVDSSMPLFQSFAKVELSEPDRHPRLTCEWHAKWFQPHVLRELLAIDLAIKRVDGQALNDFARVAFSNILRASSNAHSGYPNVMFDKNSPIKGSPIPPFFKTLHRNKEMVTALSRVNATWDDVAVIHGNATGLPLANASADAVISHPPYVGSIPYAEYGMLSLRWLGTDPKHLDRELTGGHRQSKDVVERFENGFAEMLRETYRVLRPGRYAFLMVGNPTVRGEIVRLDQMTLRLANNIGLELVAQDLRNGMNRRGNNMGAEHILFFRKPSQE